MDTVDEARARLLLEGKRMRRDVLVVVVAMGLAAAPVVADGDYALLTDRLYSPIADVDGDGADDLVEDERVVRVTETDNVMERQVLRVRSSRDHSIIWEWVRPPEWRDDPPWADNLHVVRFGPDERPAVMVAHTGRSETTVTPPSTPVNLPDEIRYSEVTHRSMTFDGATGLALSRTELPAPTGAATTEPVVADVLPGAAHELVAYRQGPGGVVLDVVDGRTGQARQVPVASAVVGSESMADRPPLSAAIEVIDDVDGDGLGDLLMLTERLTGPAELELVSLGGEAATTRWSRPVIVDHHRVPGRTFGDVTGDGVAEIVLSHRPTPEGQLERVLLDGATGEVAFVFDDDHGHRIQYAGDLDGEPGGEIAIYDNLEVQFLRSDGTRVATADLRPHRDAMVGGFDYFRSLGDIDDDGRPELAAEFVFYSSGADFHSTLVIDGDRVQVVDAGRVRGLEGTGQVVNTTNDSVILRDATSLEKVWEYDSGRRNAFFNLPVGADVTGDATPDVLVADRGLRMIDGRTGDTRLIQPSDDIDELVRVLDLRR